MAMADTSLAPTATIASSSRATPARDLARVDQAPALADAGEGRQLAVLVPLADAGGLVEARRARLPMSPENTARRAAP